MAIIDYSQGYPFMLGGEAPRSDDEYAPWDAKKYEPRGIGREDAPSILTALLGRNPQNPADAVPGGAPGMAADMGWENFDHRSANMPGMEAGLLRAGGAGGPQPAAQAPMGPPAPAMAPQGPPAQPAVPDFVSNAQQAPFSLLTGQPQGGQPAGGQPPAAPTPTDITSRARPPMGAPAPAAGPAPGPGADPEEPGFFEKINNFTKQNPMLLMSLAAGFAGAPSFGTGMSRAFGNAVAGGQLDQKQNLATQAQASTFRALVAAGMPRQQALAAAQNPDIMKIVAPDYLGTRKAEIQKIEEQDAFGNKRTRLVAWDPYERKLMPVDGGGTGGAGGAGNAGVDGTPSALPGQPAKMFAPGVTMDNFDHTKTGDEYLGQFSPEVQASAKAYVDGRAMPTGRQGASQVIKQIAQKYGADKGIDVSDQAIAQRKEWATSLGNTKSGVGMQAKGFQQGLEHMAKLSDTIVKKGNWNGLGLEPLAQAANSLRGHTTSQADVINQIGVHSQNLAGETGKLFSGSSGGGVKERREMQERFGDPNMSGPAAAGALEAGLEAMQGGLSPLEQRRDQLFPHGNAPAGSTFVGDREQQLMSHIRENIEKLRTGRTGDAGAQAPAGPQITSGLLDGTLKPEQYPQQWALVQEARRRGLIPAGKN
jgi:hypothetical protein